MSLHPDMSAPAAEDVAQEFPAAIASCCPRAQAIDAETDLTWLPAQSARHGTRCLAPLGIVGSLFIHSAALGAWLLLEWWSLAPLEQVVFSGKRHVAQIEVTELITQEHRQPTAASTPAEAAITQPAAQRVPSETPPATSTAQTPPRPDETPRPDVSAPMPPQTHIVSEAKLPASIAAALISSAQRETSGELRTAPRAEPLQRQESREPVAIESRAALALETQADQQSSPPQPTPPRLPVQKLEIPVSTESEQVARAEPPPLPPEPTIDAAELTPPPREAAEETPLPPIEVAQAPRAASPAAPRTPVDSSSQHAGTDDKEPPSFLGNRKPIYPADAYRRGLEGEVYLRIVVDASGRVTRVEVARSSGHTILDQAAVETIRTWRGTPGRRNGRPVRTVELLPVRFVLSEG